MAPASPSRQQSFSSMKSDQSFEEDKIATVNVKQEPSECSSGIPARDVSTGRNAETESSIFPVGLYQNVYRNHDTSNDVKERVIVERSLLASGVEVRAESTKIKKKQKAKEVYKCPHCILKFTSLQCLNEHSKRHVDEKSRTCLKCGKVFLRFSDFQRHSWIHSREQPFQCSVCHTGFRLSTDLRIHVRSHIGLKPYQCALCKRAFGRSCRLKKHVLLKHLQKSNHLEHAATGTVNSTSGCMHEEGKMDLVAYQCSECKAQFTTIPDLQAHIDIHDNETPLLSLEALTELLQAKQREKQKKPRVQRKRIKCDANCRNAGDLIRHMRIHTGDKPFQCPHCPAVFSQKWNLKTHVMKHTGDRPYECLQCPLAFTRSTHLSAHVTSKHSQNESDKAKNSALKKLQCSDCSHKFRYMSELKRHTQSKHSAIRPFKCSECSATFAHAYTLKDHVREHATDKPFKCSECLEGFVRSSRLKRHMETKHKRKS